LFISGDQDHLFLNQIVNWTARDPNARLHIIENAGHLCNIENPEEFNRLCLEYLQERDLCRTAKSGVATVHDPQNDEHAEDGTETENEKKGRHDAGIRRKLKRLRIRDCLFYSMIRLNGIKETNALDDFGPVAFLVCHIRIKGHHKTHGNQKDIQFPLKILAGKHVGAVPEIIGGCQIFAFLRPDSWLWCLAYTRAKSSRPPLGRCRLSPQPK
jgi:hypothetical protein